MKQRRRERKRARERKREETMGKGQRDGVNVMVAKCLGVALRYLLIFAHYCFYFRAQSFVVLINGNPVLRRSYRRYHETRR